MKTYHATKITTQLTAVADPIWLFRFQSWI